MNGFIYGIYLQWKLDFRNKEILLTCYVVPLLFFGFMGGIFTSINPISKETLIQSMVVFAVTMGASLGVPIPIVEFFNSDVKKAYKVGGIPLWISIINTFVSAVIHLFIVSTIIFFVAPKLYGATVPNNYDIYFISLFIFIIASVLVGVLIGLIAKSTSKLTMISQFIFLPSIMLSGIMFPKEFLPNMFSNIGNIFPATWGYKMLQQDNLNIIKMYPLLIIIIILLITIIFRVRAINKK